MGAREFWWDELDRLILRQNNEYDADEILRELHVEPAEDAQRALFMALWIRLRPMRADTRRSTLDAIADRIGSPEPDGVRPLTCDELVMLAGRPGITIGAHTVSHAWLAGFDAATQRSEITDSRAQLEELTGRSITTFAYPYGDRGAYDATAVAAARSAGFDAAFINSVGSIDRGSSMFELPRLYVKNWTADEFERRLHWMFDAR
jgi:peptidoglycan/xylan/chitin deacetylase (PgdA/CDA1 family)